MKKIACSLVAFAAAATAFADVLLWQVPTSPVTGADTSNKSWDGTWEYAMLKYTDSTTLNYYNAGDVDVNAQGTTYYGGTGGDDLTVWGADSTLAGETISTAYADNKNWYIALYDSSDNLVGFSSLMMNSEVQEFRAKSHNIASWDNANTMGGSGMTFTAAPEPTSGVLLLFGVAALGLRRRKVA